MLKRSTEIKHTARFLRNETVLSLTEVSVIYPALCCFHEHLESLDVESKSNSHAGSAIESMRTVKSLTLTLIFELLTSGSLHPEVLPLTMDRSTEIDAEPA